MTNFFRAILLLALVVGCADLRKDRSDSKSGDEPISHNPVFHKVDTKTSGIDFSNTITHDVASLNNLFDYDYFYNGAGVGVEDLNNDGLLDVFFCGN